MRWGSNEPEVEIFVIHIILFIMIITTIITTIITAIITIASSSGILISAGATIGMRWGSNELEVEEGDGVSWVTWHFAMLCDEDDDDGDLHHHH